MHLVVKPSTITAKSKNLIRYWYSNWMLAYMLDATLDAQIPVYIQIQSTEDF